MPRRRYYSARKGLNTNSKNVDLDFLKRLFIDMYREFDSKSYFQGGFGYFCVDAGHISGNLGTDIEAQVVRLLRKTDIWPIDERYADYSEEDLFDVIEFLYDNVSKPTKGWYHDFGNCGWHSTDFDVSTGRNEFREYVNDLLADYGDRYELSPEGEILLKGQEGLDKLLHASFPLIDPSNIDGRVSAAVTKYRRYHSTLDERRDAIRDLADVLEYLRPKLAAVISKQDENDLFNLANNFGIRHHNERQKTDYDRSVWYSWMFYYYLATIHAVIRLLHKTERVDKQAL